MPKILIVDDDNDFLEACKMILKRENYEVLSANSVPEAEPLIEEGGLDLILLDIMMDSPDDGISLAHKLKKKNIGTPVIILSGASEVTGFEYKCDEMLPCREFIEKPVTPDVLLRKVKEAIG